MSATLGGTIRGRRAARVAAAGLGVVGLLLAGCQPQGQGPTTTAGQAATLAVAADDPCNAHRSSMLSAQDFFTTALVAGAGVGAAGGGLVGALFGAEMAVLGAATGAAAGAGGGYWAAKTENADDMAAVAAEINRDIVGEIRQIDRATVTFVTLRKCRLDHADEIKEAYAAGEIDRATAEARLQRHRNLFAEEVAMARDMGVQMRTRATTFAEASTELVGAVPEAADDVETARAEAAAQMAERRQGMAAAIPFPNALTHRLRGSADLREAPSAGAASLGAWPSGQRMIAVRVQDDWMAVKLQGEQVAYLPADAVEPLPEAGALAETVVEAPQPAMPEVREVAEGNTEQSVAAVAVNATETLPFMRESFDSEVAQAESDLEVAFNLGGLTAG